MVILATGRYAWAKLGRSAMQFGQTCFGSRKIRTPGLCRRITCMASSPSPISLRAVREPPLPGNRSDAWRGVSRRSRPDASTMPNHLHGIVAITDIVAGGSRTAPTRKPLRTHGGVFQDGLDQTLQRCRITCIASSQPSKSPIKHGPGRGRSRTTRRILIARSASKTSACDRGCGAAPKITECARRGSAYSALSSSITKERVSY